MLLESEKQALEKELEVERKEHRALKTEFQRMRLALESSLSLAEHKAETDKLKRYQCIIFYVDTKKTHYFLFNIVLLVFL